MMLVVVALGGCLGASAPAATQAATPAGTISSWTPAPADVTTQISLTVTGVLDSAWIVVNATVNLDAPFAVVAVWPESGEYWPAAVWTTYPGTGQTTAYPGITTPAPLHPGTGARPTQFLVPVRAPGDVTVVLGTGAPLAAVSIALLNATHDPLSVRWATTVDPAAFFTASERSGVDEPGEFVVGQIVTRTQENHVFDGSQTRFWFTMGGTRPGGSVEVVLANASYETRWRAQGLAPWSCFVGCGVVDGGGWTLAMDAQSVAGMAFVLAMDLPLPAVNSQVHENCPFTGDPRVDWPS